MRFFYIAITNGLSQFKIIEVFTDADVLLYMLWTYLCAFW